MNTTTEPGPLHLEGSEVVFDPSTGAYSTQKIHWQDNGDGSYQKVAYPSWVTHPQTKK